MDCFLGGVVIPWKHPTTLLLPSHPAKGITDKHCDSTIRVCIRKHLDPLSNPGNFTVFYVFPLKMDQFLWNSCVLKFSPMFYFSRRERDTFGHVEAAFLQLLILLAERARAAPEVDAAVQARWFLQVVLHAHWGALGATIQPLTTYCWKQIIQCAIHEACCKQAREWAKETDSFYACIYQKDEDKIFHRKRLKDEDEGM